MALAPTLNWKELALLAHCLESELKGMFVDRILVPERAEFPSGYLKGEWILRLTCRKGPSDLLFSIRPRHPYVTLRPGKGPKAASQATWSPLSLSLSKALKGSRILGIQALHQERILVFWFSAEAQADSAHRSSQPCLGLVLFLIPAVPEAFLILSESQGFDDPATSPPLVGSKVLARSRTVKEEKPENLRFELPPSGNRSLAPQNPPVRFGLDLGISQFSQEIERELKKEAFELRHQSALKALNALIKQAQERIEQSQTAAREASHEPDWQKRGDLLKACLHENPPLMGKTRSVTDYETGQSVLIPCDPKLSLSQQVEKFYQNAKRKQRRISEANTRCERFTQTLEELKAYTLAPIQEGNWGALEKLERASHRGTSLPSEQASLPTRGASGRIKKSSHRSWLGKTFTSADGMAIWVGRDRQENLELTFQCSKGNDVWMHVRGKPGAHVLIPIPSGKSAPLETLIDAAHLAIHYSGGSHWGKTEVDYTFKKYVKRIKDSTEASYTHNKTLLITPDQARIKRLLDQMGKS
ncbi:MAG: NFACT RNA binding domain-containing protein [Bdellovibrionia bacterium]